MPEQIGRLQRLRRVGVGGFATVWLYHDPELDSPVALKALADNWAQREDVRERFLTEAKILRRAENEYIVRVYDIGQVDEVPYFVMTYADRGSVADLLTGGDPPDPDTVAELIGQAGKGLDALHRHGIIHRDIKPNNLLLRAEPDGNSRLLVADLGVAKEILHASGLTQVVGTPAYMAPEQATGIGIDLRADVHGLGAVAYTLLTGRHVRDGGIEALLSADLPAPPSTHVDLSDDVDAVVLRAVHPDPEKRWPDVLSFTEALAAAVNSMRDPDEQDTAIRAAIAARPAASGSQDFTESSVSEPPRSAGRAGTRLIEPEPDPRIESRTEETPSLDVVGAQDLARVDPGENSGRSPRSAWLTVFWVIVVFGATFGAAYLLVNLLR